MRILLPSAFAFGFAIFATAAWCVGGFSFSTTTGGMSYGRCRSSNAFPTTATHPLSMADGDKNENNEDTDATAAEELARLEDQKLLDDLLLSNTDETGTTEDGDSVVGIEGTGYVMVVSEVEEEEEEETKEEEEEGDADESESLAVAMEALSVAIDDTEKVEEEEVLAINEEEEEQDKDDEGNDEVESEAVALSIDDTETVEEVLAPEEEDNEEEGEDEEESEIFAVAIDDAKVEEQEEEENTAEVEVVTPTFFFATERGKDSPTGEGLDLETVAIVAGEIARDLLSVLRFGAANLLTQSLPDDQRQDLLTRMGAAPPVLPSSATDDAATAVVAVAQIIPAKEERASIQEEIALARAEEAQKNEEKWERQKDDILSEMEEAANARVENELKIQKMKLEEETQKLLKEKDQAMEAELDQFLKAIKIEKEMVEVLLTSREEEKDEESKEVDSISDDDVAMEVHALFGVGTDEEGERNRELEILLKKRKQQQAALDSIEDELRSSVKNEAEQRELLQSMLMKRQGQQEELNMVESKLRAQVKGIESEKARYRDLMAELDTVKETVWKPTKDASSELVEDETDGESDEEDKEDHPVLGPLVADLGYKRIHFVSSGRLGTIPVWNRNR